MDVLDAWELDFCFFNSTPLTSSSTCSSECVNLQCYKYMGVFEFGLNTKTLQAEIACEIACNSICFLNFTQMMDNAD